MSKLRIRYLIGLMSLALLGLIIFQFYWIKEVTNANEDRFTQSIQSALSTVANKLAMQNDAIFLDQDINRTIPYNRARLENIRDTLKTIEDSSYYGGGTPACASPITQSVYKDNFVVATEYIGPIDVGSFDTVKPKAPTGFRVKVQ